MLKLVFYLRLLCDPLPLNTVDPVTDLRAASLSCSITLSTLSSNAWLEVLHVKAGIEGK